MIPNMGFEHMTCRSRGNNVTPTLLQFAKKWLEGHLRRVRAQ